MFSLYMQHILHYILYIIYAAYIYIIYFTDYYSGLYRENSTTRFYINLETFKSNFDFTQFFFFFASSLKFRS